MSIGITYRRKRKNARVPRRPIRTFWDRVSEVLKADGIKPNQTEVAGWLGIKQPSVSEWTKPGGFPTIENGVRLAKKIGACVEWLYTEEGPKRPIPPDPAAQRLWDLWSRLDDSTRGELVGLASGRAGALREDCTPRPKSA